MAAKSFPWVKWSEADFLACLLVPRMRPLARLHLRSIILSCLAQPEPWLEDDGKLWRIADAESPEAWAAIKAEVLEEFVPNEDGRIAHPLAIRMAAERIEIAGARSKAARSRWTPAALREVEETGLPASAEAKALAEEICSMNYQGNVSIDDSSCALLDPILAEQGMETVKPVVQWLLTSKEAGEFFRDVQFAGCSTPEAVVKSFVKSYDRLAQNSAKKPAKKPSKSATDAAAIIARYSGGAHA